MSFSTIAVVPAAGQGSRFGEKIPKSLYRINGRSPVSRVLETLCSVKDISKIILLYPAEYREQFAEEAASFGERVLLVEGGDTRQASVRLGLEYAKSKLSAGDKDIVLVHDAARCFASPEIFRRAISGCIEYGAVTCAVPVTDSLVKTEAGRAALYLDRSEHALIQTPQAFLFGLIYKAHLEAFRSGENNATDDASLLEGLHPVQIVAGEKTNLKVTVKEDLIILGRYSL